MPQGIPVKSILNKTKHRDSWFLDDYTINPYSGCSFNCLFCYIRGSKYGEHMEQKLSIKINASELLDKQLSLRARKQQYGFIVLSSATDPYLQFEEKEKRTREILEIILKYRFPVHILTRSHLVTRDIDLLQEINKNAILPPDLAQQLTHKTLVTFSFSTLDDATAKIFEPGATPPTQRLQTLREMLNSGLHTGISLMPLLPFITDTGENLQHMFQTFANEKVKYIMPATLTLFGNGSADSKTLVLRAVEKHYPHLLEKYRTFFNTSNEMPAFYQKAFYAKTQELANFHGLKTRIL